MKLLGVAAFLLVLNGCQSEPQIFTVQAANPPRQLSAFVYGCKTNALLPLYTDESRIVPMANPAIADSQGRMTFVVDSSHKTCYRVEVR